jgi:hypothetical protein
MIALCRTSSEWTPRYEALRAHAVGETLLDFVPLGLALLRHRGTAAWMAAESSSTDSDLSTASVRPRRQRRRNDPLDGPRSELVLLLAGTALLVARGRAS